MKNRPRQTELTRRERKKLERRLLLRDTALELFVEHGYANVSIEQITEVADVSRATFFNYFPKKEDVLVDYHRCIYDEVHAFAGRLDDPSGRVMFRKYYRHLTRLVESEGDRYRVLHQIMSARADLRNDVEYQHVFEHYRRFVAAAVEAGELSPDINQLLFAEIVRDVWHGNLHEWVIDRRPKALEKRMIRKLDILFSVS